MGRPTFGFDTGAAQLDDNTRIYFQTGTWSSRDFAAARRALCHCVNNHSPVSHSCVTETCGVADFQFNNRIAAVLANEFDSNLVLIDRTASDFYTAGTNSVDIFKSCLNLCCGCRVVQRNRRSC